MRHNFIQNEVTINRRKIILVPNSTSDVMEWIMYDHFPGLVYLSNHDVTDMSQIITDNFTTNVDRVVPRTHINMTMRFSKLSIILGK